MSESTNTPNGDSKNLYSKNEDIDMLELNIADLSQHDPAIDLTTGNRAGDNTIVGGSTSLNDVTTRIENNGYVIASVSKVEPVFQIQRGNKLTQEEITAIKNAIKRFAKTIYARGGIPMSEYIDSKKRGRENPRDKDENEKDEGKEV